MARVTYQASAQNKPWSPNLVPDTADRILKQSEDYIKKLQAARDFESAQDAEFIQQYTASLQRGVDQKQQIDAEQERQARALASYKQSLLADQARRARTIGGSVTGDDNKTMQWAKFITEASTTAANAYKEINKINDTANKVIGAELDAVLPVTPFKMGVDKQLTAARTASQRQENLAMMLEKQGDFVNAERVRKTKAGAYAEFERRRAIAHGRNMPGEFQRALYAENSIMDIVLPDGSTKPINEIRGEAEMRSAWSQFRTPYFEQAGFDVQNRTTLDGLAQSETSGQTMFAEITRQEVAAAKQNRLDDADTAFTILVQDPDQAQAAAIDLYQDNYNLNGGDHKAARTAVMEAFKNPGQTSQEAFLAWQQTVLPGQNRTVEELYGDEIREVRQARLGESAEIQKETDVQQQTEAKAEAQRVYQARLLDAEADGDVDLSPENVKAQIEKYTRLGPNWSEARKAWEALIPELSSTKRDEELNDDFQALADRGALSEDFIMRSDGSEELKRKWLKSVNATAQQGVSKDDLEDFEDLARTMLMDRTGETPGMTGRSQNAYTKRALRYAVQQYRKDYVTALRDGQTPTQAAAYAEGRFNAAFISESGKYKVTQATETKDGEEITVGQYSNFGPNYSSAMDEPFVDIKKKFEELGPAAVDTPGVIPRPTLERVQKSLQQNNRIMIPPNIVFMADYSGGKLSVMDVLNRQLKAAGLEQIPPDIYNTAKETQDSVAPEWQQRLNYKPQYSTVDAAMIGSGQEPIYAQSTPAQERIKEIFSKRESPRMGYNAVNRGKGGDTPGGIKSITGKEFREMTLGEVKYYQNLPLGHPQGIMAAGMFQFIPETLAEAATAAGITDDMLFTEAVQDRIFFVHLDRYGAHGPWEQWWIQQGGQHLALTPEEKQVIATFRNSYDPSKPWSQAKNLNPAVIPAIPQEPEQEQATELTGYFKFDEDGNKIPAN